MTPTKEQQAILDTFQSTMNLPFCEDNMKVLALAGTGKTHTLLELVVANPNQSFLYLAFNKSIKDEVDKISKSRGITNLKAQTQNSFCLSLARGAGMTARDIKGYLSVKSIISRLDLWSSNDRFMVYPAGQIMSRFLTSQDPELNESHIPTSVKTRIEQNVRRYARHNTNIEQETEKRINSAFRIAKRLFASFDFNSDIMMHDVYVKLVGLHYTSVPVAEDVVLLDEAQDINPVFSDIVDKMDARVIAVGDSNQAIYQFRGARDFLKDMPTENVLTLTKSFRFTPEIAEKVNKLLRHMTDLRLEGFGSAGGDGSKAILCRTNVGCLKEAFALMGSDERFLLQGGIDSEGFKMVEDMIALYEGRFQDVQHPDLKGIRNMGDLEKELQDMLLDAEWKQVLRLIDKMGGFDEATNVINKIKDSQKKLPKDATVITTGHKSKGSGYDIVRISDDFEAVFYKSMIDTDTGKRLSTPIPFCDAPSAEQNLFYVACTRSKTVLEVGLCERLFSDLDEVKEAA